MSPALIAWGTPWTAQSVGRWRRSTIAVLDVVVDEAEVVAELDGRGTRQRREMVAGDRRVGEEPEERPDPLAGRRAIAVEPEVVADHLVDAGGRWVAVVDDAEDLRLRVGDQGLSRSKSGETVAIAPQCSGIASKHASHE